MIKRLVLNIVFLLLPIFAITQSAGYVRFTGQVKLRGCNNDLTDVTVKFFAEGEAPKEIKAVSSQNFQINLDFNKNYSVEISKPGLVKQKLEFDTHIPEDALNKIHPFFTRIYLFPDYKEIDMSIYNSPGSVIRYDEGEDKFVFDYTGFESVHQQRDDNDKQILDLTKKKLQAFENAKSEGDRAYDERLFQAALGEYNKAAVIFPQEVASYYVDIQYIEGRKKICNKMVEEAKLNQGEYNKTIEVADKLFDSKEYVRAKVSYQKALKLRPGSEKASQRIKEIDKITAENKVHNVLYDVAIESAMKWLDMKDYEKAIADFEQASLLKPDEDFPKRKIKELNDILSGEKARRDSYNDLITEGNSKFKQKKYQDSKTDYVEALKIYPDEKYPLNRINEIDIILKELANQKEFQRKYDELISSADALFSDDKLQDAKTKYADASNLKPAEIYPKSKISEVDKILAERKVQQQAYDEAVKLADGLFESGDYEKAKAQYNVAHEYLPEKEYPTEKIAEIDNIIAEQVLKLANDKKYKEVLSLADQQFEKEEYELSKGNYEKAIEIKPDEEYPRNKITEIDNVLAARKDLNDKYSYAVTRGDKLFDDKQYIESRKSFEEALTLKPGENYPKQKIEEIVKLLKEQEETQESYDKLIAEADQFYTEKKYLKSKQLFEEALNVKPGEKYPSDKIKEIESILADAMAKEDAYNKAITSGDESFGLKEYEKAKEHFLSASELKPGEKYPKDRLQEIADILARNLERDESYKAAIARGDEKFNNKLYKESKTDYEEAIKIKADEKYPRDRISEIDGILAKIAEDEFAYKESIALGDKNFKSKEYLRAKENYLKAAEIKPEETYSKEKIREIEDILAEARSLQESYDNAVKEADGMFTAKEYTGAKTAYEKALSFKADESYPKERIAEIDKIVAELKAKQEAYDKAIALGDERFAANDLLKAKESFTEAQGIKPGESYPAEKIKIINSMLADAKVKQQAYDAAIASGDSQLSAKDYEKARGSYTDAAEIKPEEKYPKEKISEIDAILADMKARDENYAAVIAEADKKFEAKSYPGARISYEEAIKIKPGEQYPAERIKEIDKILADIKAKEDAYSEAISMADKSFEAKNYETARGGYQKASEIKSQEDYPKEKIAEIDKILSEMRSLQESYDNAVKEADGLYTAKEYSRAKTAYEKALSFKADESYPKERIAEIDKIVAELKAKQEAYDKAITLGDERFAANDLLKAKESFTEAQGIKPGESYPAEKIKIIDSMLADAKAKQEAYDAAIASGDEQFANKNFANAKESFTKASGIKPEESYPKEKITEIEKILADILAKDNAYQKAVADADNEFTNGSYAEAKVLYEEAQKIKPEEKYPGEKIAEIDKILAEIKLKREQYDGLITKADDYFNSKKFNDAIQEYKKASEILTNEEYPKERIAAIEKIIADIKAKEELYKKSISSADQKFNAKQFEDARSYYQKALDTKPGEDYPADRIKQIDDMLAEIKRINDAFDNAVSSGASYFKMKEYQQSLQKYQEASEIKPDEQFVKDKIIEINNILLADARDRQAAYDKTIALADDYANKNDLKNALKEYKNASNIKPDEQYPQKKISEIEAIFREEARLLREKYDGLITEADKLYEQRLLDLAILKYKQASSVLPEELYPKQKINEITKYIIDNAIVEVNKETIVIPAKEEKKFPFEPVDIRARKSTYIFLKIKNISNTKSKLFLNYGKDGAKSGGVTFDLEENDMLQDYIIRVSVQDKWFRVDNNWLSIYPQGGDIEVTSIRISKGD